MDKQKLLLQLIDEHRRQKEQFYNRILMIIIPLKLMSIAGFVYCLFYYIESFEYYYYGYDSYKVGSCMLGTFALVLISSSCIFLCLRTSTNRYLKNFSNLNAKMIIWRLENEQWINYLEYVYGPNRSYEHFGGSSWSSRQAKYNRLKTRNYGHIIFNMHGIIIDEFKIFKFEKKTLLISTKLIPYFSQDYLLRFTTLNRSLLKDKTSITNDDIQESCLEFDILIPNIFYQSMEKLNQMIDLFDQSPIFDRYLNPNFNQIHALFQ